MENALYFGTGLVLITFIIGLVVAKPYSEDNFQQVASVQRKICVSYVIGFAAITYGGTITLGDAWWAWVIVVISVMCGFGARLEAMKTLPNAPKELQKD